eukprot:gene6194-18254_t
MYRGKRVPRHLCPDDCCINGECRSEFDCLKMTVILICVFVGLCCACTMFWIWLCRNKGWCCFRKHRWSCWDGLQPDSPRRAPYGKPPR